MAILCNRLIQARAAWRRGAQLAREKIQSYSRAYILFLRAGKFSRLIGHSGIGIQGQSVALLARKAARSRQVSRIRLPGSKKGVSNRSLGQQIRRIP
jgi:hypothetical protein